MRYLGVFLKFGNIYANISLLLFRDSVLPSIELEQCIVAEGSTNNEH